MLNFLFPKSGKDQWDYEISNYFSYNSKIFYLYLSIHTFFEWVWRKMFWMLLGDTVVKSVH